MKKFIYIAGVTMIAMTSCKKDSFLTRAPLSDVSPQQFFKNETDLQLFCNQYYVTLPVQTFLRADDNSDDKANQTINQMLAGTYPIPPSASLTETDLPGTGAANAGTTGQLNGTGTNWNFVMIRNCNFFLANYAKADISDSIKNIYVGETLFFRANEYWKKVKAFGDVNYINQYIVDTSKTYLYGPRMPHQQVMDSVLNDLNFAAAHIPVKAVQSGRITKYAALALKARVCLWEGTYRKYWPGSGDPLPYLQAAADAAEAIMNSGAFSIYSTGHPGSDYYNLFIQEDLTGNPEAILPMTYAQGILMNDIDRQLGQVGDGYSKDFVRDILCTDGEPISVSKLYLGDSIPDAEAKNRDPRYAQQIATKGFDLLDGDTITLPRIGTANTSTGYQCIKGRSSSLAAWNANASVFDFFIFRYAETLLIDAEARAELGTCTQSVLDNTINKLRDRVNMVHLKTDVAKDPASHFPDLDALTDEIRRERRVELGSEGFRWDDLHRWHAGTLANNPATILGMKLTNDLIAQYVAADSNTNVGTIPLDANNFIRVYPGITSRTFDPKMYLFPIPTQEITLNPNIKQNPGW